MACLLTWIWFRNAAWLASLVLVCLSPIAVSTAQVEAGQASGGVAAAQPVFQAVRSVSGSKGEVEAGQYVVQDPRTVFYVPDDHQVIVYFEWDGPPGPHHVEGLWKDPDGKVEVISDFDYTATGRRFGGHWSLLLAPEGMKTGVWTVEARIDGETAGTHAFQIVAAPRPAGAADVTAPRILEPSEIYERARAATVSIQKLNAARSPTGSGSGFLIGNNLLLTGFELIDGATALRVTLPEGEVQTLDSLLAWDRLQDWAVLKLPIAGSHQLSLGKPGAWQVGDRAYTLDEPQPGNRELATGSVTGRRTFPELGDRIDFNFSLQSAADGSPVLNTSGDVIGMVLADSLLPGSRSVRSVPSRLGSSLYPNNLMGQDSILGTPGSLAVPAAIIKVPPADTAPTPLSELAQKGEFTSPIVADPDLWRGSLAPKIIRSGPFTETSENRFEYSHADGQFMVAADWDGKQKSRSSLSLRIYSLNNRPVTATEDTTLKMSKGQKMSTVWTFSIVNIPDATYRLDMVRDGRCIWRTFFRIAP